MSRGLGVVALWRREAALKFCSRLFSSFVFAVTLFACWRPFASSPRAMRAAYGCDFSYFVFFVVFLFDFWIYLFI
jgi:hypothetical protein